MPFMLLNVFKQRSGNTKKRHKKCDRHVLVPKYRCLQELSRELMLQQSETRLLPASYLTFSQTAKPDSG